MFSATDHIEATADGEAALRRYSDALHRHGLNTAEAAVDGIDLEELYSAAAVWSAKLITQFSADTELPVTVLIDDLAGRICEGYALNAHISELVRGFAQVTGTGGSWNADKAERYAAAVEADPDAATSAAALYTSALAVIVADAGNMGTDEVYATLDS